jgi:hypothetical protein
VGEWGLGREGNKKGGGAWFAECSVCVCVVGGGEDEDGVGA